MNDAFAGRHQIDLTRADRGKAADAVTMVDGAFEQPGDRGEIDMRMGPDIHSRTQIELRRAELVDEDERTHHAAGFGRQDPSNFELAQIVSGRG